MEGLHIIFGVELIVSYEFKDVETKYSANKDFYKFIHLLFFLHS